MTYELIFRYYDAGCECAERIQTTLGLPQTVRNFTLNNNLAASDWIACEVYGPQGELLTRLSYNGTEYK